MRGRLQVRCRRTMQSLVVIVSATLLLNLMHLICVNLTQVAWLAVPTIKLKGKNCGGMTAGLCNNAVSSYLLRPRST